MTEWIEKKIQSFKLIKRAINRQNAQIKFRNGAIDEKITFPYILMIETLILNYGEKLWGGKNENMINTYVRNLSSS